jgi:hypothetical protein
MSGLIKRLWHDPVWSKVIATGVTTAVAGVGYWWTRAGVWARVTAAVGSGFAGLLAPVLVPRALVWLVLALLAVAALLSFGRARRKPVHPPPMQNPISVTPKFRDLNEDQQKFLEVLLRVYPRGMDLRNILANFLVTYPAGEILAESLETLGLVDISPVYQGAKSILLTKQGRDVCYEAGLDLVG